MQKTLIFWRVSAILYGLLVIYLSLAQFQDSGGFKIWDKLAHALVYAGFGVFCWLGSTHRTQLILALCACFFLGIAIECAQGYTGYRHASVHDQLANSLGLIAGVSFCYLWRLAYRKFT